MKLIVRRKPKLAIKPKPGGAKAKRDICLPQRYLNGAAIVAKHKDIETITNWLREGISCASIARYLSQTGAIDQTAATYTDYLLQFKRCYPGLLGESPSISLDEIISANAPPVSIEGEVNRLYRLQKLRLAINTKNEIAAGRLSKDGYRDINAAHGIAETLAEMAGKMGNKASTSSQYPEEVQRTLHAIKEDEAHRSRFRELSLRFIEKLQESGYPNSTPP